MCVVSRFLVFGRVFWNCFDVLGYGGYTFGFNNLIREIVYEERQDYR